MHLLLISSQIFFSFLFFAKQNATPVHNYNLYTQKYKSNTQVLHFTLQLRIEMQVCNLSVLNDARIQTDTTSTSTTLNMVFPNKNPLKQHFVISEGYI